MVKEGYKTVGVQLPKSLANAVQTKLKGQSSRIAQKAFELALGVNGELSRAQEELKQSEDKTKFLKSYVAELKEKKKNRPVRYKTIC